MLRQSKDREHYKSGRGDSRARKHLRVDVQLAQPPRDEVSVLAAGGIRVSSS